MQGKNVPLPRHLTNPGRSKKETTLPAVYTKQKHSKQKSANTLIYKSCSGNKMSINKLLRLSETTPTE